MVSYKKVCHLHPGEYFQVHQEYERQNTIAIDRTVSAISLRPQRNLQGGYFFESLLTDASFPIFDGHSLNTAEMKAPNSLGGTNVDVYSSISNVNDCILIQCGMITLVFHLAPLEL